MKAFAPILICSLFLMVSIENLYADMICPDAVSVCPDTATCCVATDGAYSCCPFENAVCCDDHIHCCPERYKCDLHIFKCDHIFRPRRLDHANSSNIAH